MLAENVLRPNANNLSAAINHAFFILTSRHPDEDEQKILIQMVNDQHSWYESHPENAQELLGVGQKSKSTDLNETDVAALATVINGLFAHDESVVKR